MDGYAIDTHFDNKKIGSGDVLPARLNGRGFRIFGMKEEVYIMKLMSTYGELRCIGDASICRRGKWAACERKLLLHGTLR